MQGKRFEIAACLAYLSARHHRIYQAREQQRRALLEALRPAVRAILPRFPGVQKAYLFGSVLRPAAMRSTSDIDIAIEGELSAEEYFTLWRQLEQTGMSWPIELVELDQDLLFAERVRQRGELIYERRDTDPES